MSNEKSDGDELNDFEGTFSHGGRTRTVVRIGTGPAVIVIHEIPGITPKVADFARRVANAGFTAVCPLLLGEIGRSPSRAYSARSVAKLCVSREFNVFAAGKSSPIVEWLKALGRHEHERCGGPGIGVIGMCFSGGFALAMAADPVVLAPVMSQPSLPAKLPWRSDNVNQLDCSAAELIALRERMDADPGLRVLGYRFSQDKLVKQGRFDRLKAEFGDRFHGVPFHSEPGNPDGYPLNAHSVMTEHLVESAALEVIDFFRERLL